MPRLGVTSGDGIVAELWSFGDESTVVRRPDGVQKTRITHVYRRAGRYGARVLVTTRQGERRGAYFAVTVVAPPS